jgi:homogentisate 1,2-dioxygenase
MSFYVKRGRVPQKRHTQFRDENGNLYYEEHVSREGFSDVYANLYHINHPTAIKKVRDFEPLSLKVAEDVPHRHHHFKTFDFPPEGNWVTGRRPICINDDVAMYTASPAETSNFFYRNGNADEIIFIHQGSGTIKSMYGRMAFKEGDYIIIPRGITYYLDFDSGEKRLFIVESSGPVEVPSHYRNKYGQIGEHAPYCERDIRTPEFEDAVDEKGEFPIMLKLRAGIQHIELAHHPFDVVGWDGYYYPWIFNINDYMPRVGKVHLPPPTHLTFNSPGFVLCSFVPRPYDFHEEAVPIPYAHSNVDSDEVIYYADGRFMSRKGIEVGSITLHPSGIPHGPQPGLAEKSLGKKETNELAVMVDTFRPLHVAKAGLKVDDPKYPFSWLED